MCRSINAEKWQSGSPALVHNLAASNVSLHSIINLFIYGLNNNNPTAIVSAML